MDPPNAATPVQTNDGTAPLDRDDVTSGRAKAHYDFGLVPVPRSARWDESRRPVYGKVLKWAFFLAAACGELSFSPPLDPFTGF